MSCAWTFCLDCEEFTNHKLVDVCEHCGSRNVEQDYEQDEMNPPPDMNYDDFEDEDDDDEEYEGTYF